jgi:hypothetical protein
MTSETTKTLTIRLPEALHQAAREAADRSQISLNTLVQTATETYLRHREEEALFESFSRLGEELTECDVEFAREAQREVVERAG